MGESYRGFFAGCKGKNVYKRFETFTKSKDPFEEWVKGEILACSVAGYDQPTQGPGPGRLLKYRYGVSRCSARPPLFDRARFEASPNVFLPLR